MNAHMNVTSAFSDILEKFGFYEMMVGVCTKGVRVHVYVSVGERKSSRERKRERERGVQLSWNLLCLSECASATPSSLLPLCRSRPQPLVRRPLKLPCFDRCSLCPNASQRTLWRLSHSPSRVPSSLSFSIRSHHSLFQASGQGFASNEEENHLHPRQASVHNVKARP